VLHPPHWKTVKIGKKIDVFFVYPLSKFQNIPEYPMETETIEVFFIRVTSGYVAFETDNQ